MPQFKSNLEDEDLNPPISYAKLPDVAAEMVFVGDEDYQPDCPWKNSGIEQGIDEALIEDWGAGTSNGNSDSYMEGGMGLRKQVKLEGNEVGVGALFQLMCE